MENNSAYAVQMKDITIRFGSYCALNKVRLDVKKGFGTCDSGRKRCGQDDSYEYFIRAVPEGFRGNIAVW